MANFAIRSLGVWLVVRRWQLILLLLLVTNIGLLIAAAAFVDRAYKFVRNEMASVRNEMASVRNEMASVRNEMASVRSEVKETQKLLSGFDEIPLAYAETPEGLKFAPASRGATRRELEFLAAFRGRLLPKETDIAQIKSGGLRALLRDSTLKGFAEKKNFIDSYKFSERQALIAYAVLRTNGSMPTYEVRDNVPNDLKQIVVGATGNCSDYALRLMMILESLGVKATMISNVTTSLPGHVIVDAYDPQDDTAYLLDATFNVMMIHPNAKKRGFIEHLMLNKKNRKGFAHNTNLIVFPVYFRFVDPGETAYTSTPITPSSINKQREKRDSMWREWLEKDGEELISWWVRTPSHAPKTLRELSVSFLSAIPKEFDVSGDFAQGLRRVAGLEKVERAGKSLTVH